MRQKSPIESSSKSKVSIIIPIYNTEKYLKECIDSALNQTYQNLEVIAVNDGSTDGSLEILEEYSDKITIISKENGGVSSALNAGIKIASGEWIKQLDSDDVLNPNAVQELVSEAGNLKGDLRNYILYGNHEIIDSKGKILYECIYPGYNHLSSFDLNVILVDHMFGVPTTTMIHKSSFLEYGFYDESVLFAADYDLQLRFCLLHGCRPHLISKIIAKYRVHQDQITSLHMKDQKKVACKIKEKILQKLDPIERQKYQKALRQFKLSAPISTRTKKMAFDMAAMVLPHTTLHQVVKMYYDMKFKGITSRATEC